MLKNNNGFFMMKIQQVLGGIQYVGERKKQG